jgi:7-cyano-7-deazaguanine synthase
MKLVISLSGGLDSSTLAYDLMNQGHELKAISFDYGQRHKKELESARKIAKHLGIEHQIIDVSFLKDLLPGSSLTDDKVKTPEGHYEEESMKDTVVPNRNMIFASILAAHAFALKYDGIALGVHGGDHAIYPDCRPDFIMTLEIALKVGNWDSDKFTVVAPYLTVDKASIVAQGLKSGVPYEDTWTCYKGEDKPCGKCGSCQERLEAFAENKATDPLTYQDA